MLELRSMVNGVGIALGVFLCIALDGWVDWSGFMYTIEGICVIIILEILGDISFFGL